MICAFRSQGLSEGEVADKAKFGSVGNMYIRLERWGLSGLVPLEENADKDPNIHRSSGKAQTPRQPQPSEESGRKLPALANATALFRDNINTLAFYLENLPYHQVILRDGRFIATDEIPEDAEQYPIVYVRSEYTAEQWEGICAKHNKDPETTHEIYVYQDTSWSKGATHYPPWFETCLITSVLMQSPGYVERLIEEISLEPDRVPRNQIKEFLYGRPTKSEGLYSTARKLARMIRTGEVKRGRWPTPIPQFRQAQAQTIKEGREKGLTDERIRQMLEINEEEFKVLEDLLFD